MYENLVKNENDIIKTNPPISLKLFNFIQTFWWENDLSMLESIKNFNIENLIEIPCQMKEGKIVEGCIIIVFIIFFLVNETCHPIWPYGCRKIACFI